MGNCWGLKFIHDTNQTTCKSHLPNEIKWHLMWILKLAYVCGALFIRLTNKSIHLGGFFCMLNKLWNSMNFIWFSYWNHTGIDFFGIVCKYQLKDLKGLIRFCILIIFYRKK